MPETRPPNVILLMVDQMKAAASHLYSPHGIRTPGLERLARLGVRYENAITPHPLCVPARVAMWTGKYPHHTNCRLNQTFMPPGMPHAAKWWKDAGYQLALLGKNHCFEEQSDRALFDVWCEITHRGFSDPTSPRGMPWVESEEAVTKAHVVRKQMPPTPGSIAHATTEFEERHYSTGLLSNQSDAYVRAPKDKPYILWLSIPDPHTPLETPKHFFDEAKNQNIKLPPLGSAPGRDVPERNRLLSQMLRWPDAEMNDLENAVTAYHANILHIDKLVNRLLDTLEETRQTDETLIVFCADHGDYGGEHQMLGKGGAFYDCLVRIPMILAAPSRLQPDQVETAPVSLLDVIPTLFRLQGLTFPEGLDGEPMPPLKGSRVRSHTFSEYGAGGSAFQLKDLNNLKTQYGHSAILESLIHRETEGERSMIRTNEWKFVHDSMGDLDELYHLSDDPFEHSNLAANPDFYTIKAELMAELKSWRQWD